VSNKFIIIDSYRSCKALKCWQRGDIAPYAFLEYD